jgi:hypothetical protein
MYSPIESSSSVKSNCGCAKTNPYTPSTTNAMDVSFHPIKNESGTQHYIALIENDNENVKIPSNMKINDSSDSSKSSKSSNSSDSSDSLDSSDYKKDEFNLDNEYIKTFYIGSITVVGLYILFRIIDKSR